MNKLNINWSNRSYFFEKKELKILNNFLKNSQNLTQGKELLNFENSLKKFLKTKKISVLNSGASALELSAALINIKKGDEVIIPSHTYCASAIPFARRGAKIVWADIDLDTRVLDLKDVKSKISKKTKAIVIVHLYGFAANVFKFKNLFKNTKVKIIEDCAQAFGAKLKDKYVGTIGDIGCYSFHAQKNLTTLGEGGAIFVKDHKLFQNVKGLRHNGHAPFVNQKNYWLPAMTDVRQDINNSWPYKFTLSEIQCLAGNLSLKRINKLNQLRINRAKKLITEVKQVSNKLSFVESFKNKRHVYHLLSAKVESSGNLNRDNLIKFLFENFGIKCATQYYPLYKYDLFKKKKNHKGKCPNTELFFKNMISFPFHVWMSEKKYNQMINRIKYSISYLENK